MPANLSACASAPANPPPMPAAVVAAPTQWQAPLPHNGQLTDLSRRWQDLGDPLLVDLIAAAQQASPTLASAGARVSQSRAALRQAQARLGPTLAAYQARVRQAVRETEEALVALQSTAGRAEDAQAAEAGYRDWLQATEARYQGGLASLVELEDARRTRLASANTTVGLQLERIQAWIALYRAAGGGWTVQQPPVDGQP